MDVQYILLYLHRFYFFNYYLISSLLRRADRFSSVHFPSLFRAKREVISILHRGYFRLVETVSVLCPTLCLQIIFLQRTPLVNLLKTSQCNVNAWCKWEPVLPVDCCCLRFDRWMAPCLSVTMQCIEAVRSHTACLSMSAPVQAVQWVFEKQDAISYCGADEPQKPLLYTARLSRQLAF